MPPALWCAPLPLLWLGCFYSLGCDSRLNYTHIGADDTVLQPLLTRRPANLRGLTIHGLSLQQSYVSQLAGLTGLTALQLVSDTSPACLCGV